jgi:elongation factor Ts
MKATAQDIKKLREMTSAGFADCKSALEESTGDLKKAEELLKKKGIAKAAKKGDRATGSGLVETYVHLNGKIGVVLSVLCETDFVARTDEFKHLSHEVAMQIAAMNPENNEELLKQEYIRDGSKTIEDLVKENIAKLGENIQLGKFSRLEI